MNEPANINHFIWMLECLLFIIRRKLETLKKTMIIIIIGIRLSNNTDSAISDEPSLHRSVITIIVYIFFCWKTLSVIIFQAYSKCKYRLNCLVCYSHWNEEPKSIYMWLLCIDNFTTVYCLSSKLFKKFHWKESKLSWFPICNGSE